MTVYQKTTALVNGEKAFFECELPVLEDSGKQELEIINLYPELQYQPVTFFGGAITDAVGAVLSALPPERSDEILRAYFGRDGIGYRAIRTHIDSCDFSTGEYAAVSDPTDLDLRSFSIARDEERILPWIKAAYRAAGSELPVILTPWTPPAFMKTNHDRIGGGKLKEEFYGLWAKYICRYIQAYRERGIRVTGVSIQNEPNAVQTWDSCLYSADEERRFLSDALYPELLRSGLSDIEVYIWDHNKERAFDRACAEITPETDRMIAGVAFHWYSGDHFDALRLIRECFPEKKLLFTEGCIEYSRFDRNQLANAQKYAHDMIGNFNAGMNGFLDWNICLDSLGGPNRVKNYCDAPVMCDLARGSAEYKLSFDYIGHFSRYVRAGARRTAVTKFSEGIDCTAFVDPDGSVVCILLNREALDRRVYIRISGKLIPLELPADAISTVLIRQIP